MFNPLMKKAKLAALSKMASMPMEGPAAMPMAPTPIKMPSTNSPAAPSNPMKDFKAEEERGTRVPGTTARGLKESQTKKIRNLIKPS